MNHEPGPAVVRLPGRTRLVIGAFATVASLVGAGVWAIGASADAGSAGATAQAGQALCTAPPGYPPCTWPSTSWTTTPPPSGEPSGSTSVPVTTDPTIVPPTGTPSTRTSYTWTFDDGTPGAWYGRSPYGVPPWLSTSSAAAASGRSGLVVGEVAVDGSGAAVNISRNTVVPGTYAVSARVRLAPGQPGTSFEVSGPPRTQGTYVTDGAWTTLTGSIAVPSDGTAARLLVAPGHGFCSSPNSGDYTPATSFQLDDVTLTRSSDSTNPVPPTPTATGVGCPTYSPAPPATAKIHYEVTLTSGGGFTATLVLTNLRDTPITDWAVPVNQTANPHRILWASGAQVTGPSSTDTRDRLVGAPGNTTIPARGQVRVSLGLTGSPVGSASIFTSINGQQTGRN